MLYHPCHLRVGVALGSQDIRDTVQRNPCTRNTIAQVARTICDILAKNVGIVRKAYRGGGPTHPKRAANLRRAQEQGQTLTLWNWIAVDDQNPV